MDKRSSQPPVSILQNACLSHHNCPKLWSYCVICVFWHCNTVIYKNGQQYISWSEVHFYCCCLLPDEGLVLWQLQLGGPGGWAGWWESMAAAEGRPLSEPAGGPQTAKWRQGLTGVPHWAGAGVWPGRSHAGQSGTDHRAFTFPALMNICFIWASSGNLKLLKVSI